MNTDSTTARWTRIVLTAFLLFESSALVVKVADGANKQVHGRLAAGAVNDDQNKTEKRPPSPMKKMFKDFRAGSCKTSAAPTAPNTSWAPRGEAAVSVCRS